MKRIIIIFAVLVCFLAACTPSEKEYTVRVGGDNGLEYAGSYMVLQASGDTSQRSVQGTVPGEYDLTGASVSVSFQKQSKGGRLVVEILRGGKVIKSSETTADYGIVTIATGM